MPHDVAISGFSSDADRYESLPEPECTAIAQRVSAMTSAARPLVMNYRTDVFVRRRL
jgi:hypothetical protein